MALSASRQSECAAFTLVELLVVIGIMAVLTTISVAGYSAASRGMADRGVIQATESILLIAKQTCELDRVPTKVLFFNQRLNDGSKEDDSTLYQGTAIAIRQAGRISINSKQVNGLLVDEFADWNQSYPRSGSATTPPMRFFSMKPGTDGDENADINGCSVMVRPFVKSDDLDDEYMIGTGTYMKDWCDLPDRKTRTGSNCRVWGFEPVPGAGKRSFDWYVGDPYGVEIAQIDLPKGYIFGNKEPTTDELTAASIKEVHFSPEKFEADASASSVEISAMRPDGGRYRPKKVGDARVRGNGN